MMPRMLIALLTVTASLAVAVEAPGETPRVSERPTFTQGRDVMHTILDTYALGTDGRLTLGGCQRRAQLWIVCRAQIEYKRSVTRYRFQISGTESDYVIGTSIKTAPRRAASAS